ncbi:Ltp family lipoprotein [Leuconostoc fallax]|uniref:Putative host cell surface-exposed lipoprotein Ltp-like HTH region domain-containing protein n=1 Tax=Leuconostoc fallax TaxID=1251 RepID=A0A4R5N8B9_9LACO|nr:Ltp family lipoprotein [Leuconostoc fallax]TDG68041.1 hypothetical protein C5L23_000347 [Leuconostoc fallax]
MSKKIVDENGNTYVQKKPIYKRVLFWIVAIVIIVMFGSMATKNISSKTISSSPSKSSSKSSSSSKPKVSAEFSAALAKAKTYSDTMSMSKQGIYDQLTSEAGEKFPADAAQYAIDNVKADYNKNALNKAKTYQEKMSMSVDSIHDQLVSAAGEKFTTAQADYAIANLNK